MDDMAPTTTAAVIGCGDVSVVHFEALSKLTDVRLVAVCDVDPATAADAGARYRVPWFTDHEELLARARPDVVHVCTPHHQHAGPVIDAIHSGVHVGDERREVVYGENPADNQVESLGPRPEANTSGTDPAQLGAAHRLQYENFLGALAGTENLRVTLEENRRSIAVIVGAYESARTGRRVSLA